MSDGKPIKTRKAGVPINPRPRLRPVPRTDELPRPQLDGETRALMDDMRRRYRVQRERLSLGDDEPEAA